MTRAIFGTAARVINAECFSFPDCARIGICLAAEIRVSVFFFSVRGDSVLPFTVLTYVPALS